MVQQLNDDINSQAIENIIKLFIGILSEVRNEKF